MAGWPRYSIRIFIGKSIFDFHAKNWDGKLEYTNGAEWTEWDGSEISSGRNSKGRCIYIRGTGNSKITGGTYSSDVKWSITGTNVTCNGDIDLLLDYATVKKGNHPVMVNYCYSKMFQGCTSLTTTPSLPATTLTDNCYYSMFSGCTNLTTAPSLPATTLANYCYNSMFLGCTSLTTVPLLPATTLKNGCYTTMFFNCPKIKLSTTASGTYTKSYRIPKSRTGTTASDALENMFGRTGGTFTGTPEINTTYYLDTSNTIV